MVQQTLDSKVSEYGLCNPENSSLDCEKQPPVAVKKTLGGDLQNVNINDAGPAIDAKMADKDCYRGSNSSTPQFVYVRRKSEAESVKSSTRDGTSTNASNSPHSRQVTNVEGPNHLKNQIEEPKVSCFPAFSPLPNAPLTSSSEKASVPLSVEKSGTMLHSVASATPLLNSPKELNKLHWEERYCQLQMLLNRLDQSSRDDYVQMLRSLSSIELSRLAVELENKSIQLSLEEAKEMHRLALLNVLGKPLKNVESHRQLN